MATDINKKLLNCGMIEKLKCNGKKYSNIKDSKNLLAVYEQHVFVWNDVGSCILTAEIGDAEIHEIVEQPAVQILTLTNPPVFEVESLQFNQTGTLLAISGKNGITVFEVPWRYGKFSNTSDQNIIGRSWSIAELFFASNNRVKIIQAAWHPGSFSKTHLTTLSTDNYMRIYDVNDPQTPQQAISLGLSYNSAFLSSEAKINFSSCYGENAVGFDFAPPETIQVPKSKNKSLPEYELKVVWPIILLHGNGDIFILKIPVQKDKFRNIYKLEGPLTMYPPAEDNYGYDACSVLCLHSTPATIVIATATGVIYHCLLLDNTNTSFVKEQAFSHLGENLFEESSDALYVFESVELPLTLTEDQDDVLSNPIRLYKDIISHNKYHCTHVSGIHSVAIPLLKTVEECINTDNLEKVLDQQKTACIVEHILCTKPFSQVEAVPVLGVDCTVNNKGIFLLCLLASWEFVSFPLVVSFLPSAPQLLSEKSFDIKNTSTHNEIASTFERSIEKAMQRSLCSPFVKSIASQKDVSCSPQQWLDMLCNITQRFREDYFQRLTTTHALLRSRIKVLRRQREYQVTNTELCEDERKNVREVADHLAEKYENAHASQLELQKRIENVLKKLQLRVPYLSKAELDMKQTLLIYEENLKTFQVQLDQIKKKLRNQKEKCKEIGNVKEQILNTTQDFKTITFNETQVKHIKELLSQESESIAEIIRKLNSLKSCVG